MMRDIKKRGVGSENGPSRVASKPNRPTTESKPLRTKLAAKPRETETPPIPVARRAPSRAGSVLSSPQATPIPLSARPSPTSRTAENDPSALRNELLGPSFAAKPQAKPVASSPRKRELAKSLAAEIAREMAADNAGVATPEESAEPSAKLAAEPKVASEDQSPTTASPKPAQVSLSESKPTPEKSTAPTSDSEAADAFAEGLIAAATVGNRYASDEPADKAPTRRGAAEVSRSDEDIQIASIPVGVSDQPEPKIESIDQSNSLRNSQPEPPADKSMSLVIGAELKSSDRAPIVKLDSASKGDAAEDSSFGATLDPFAQAARSSAQDQSPAPVGEAELLMSGKMPLIASRVNGPRRITVGRKVKYSVLLANRGDAAADQLVARVRVPEWADVVATKAADGSVNKSIASTMEAEKGALLEWRIDRFAAQSSSQLEVTLIARQGRPIELGVDWSHAPVGARTVVEVQEPKLEINVSGPDEILYGKPLRYRLTLSNPGTGAAEDVTIFLQPPGKPASEASSHRFGSLGAGKTKTVEIELTAREAGELSLIARATGQGGVEAATEKKLFCRKPELEVDWRGPSHKYTGALATYYFRVRNPGTAAAEDVTFVVDLPAGFKVQATSAGQKYDARKRRLAWKVGALRPGDDHYLQVRGVPSAAGENQFQFAAATVDRSASDTATAKTEVVAVADLKLEVRDPTGPLPVGAETVYEVRVKNRGSSAASQVSVVAMFSDGIEPFAVEGGEFSVVDGRVSLGTLASLQAGGEKVYKIRARAESPGTHVFRAEVVCSELDTKLATQEMTRFYAEESVDLGDTPQAAQSVDRFVYPR